MTKKNIHIIGAGVGGLAIGWELAQAGYGVTLYDKGKAGRGASWAAAGMLAAIMETEPGEETLFPFALAAQKRWPDYKTKLETASGIDIGYRESGTLFIAAEADDVGLLKQRETYINAMGGQLEWLDKNDVRAREPFFSPRVSSALYSPTDHQVDNRALVEALIIACKKAGVIIHENTSVDEIVIAHNKVTGLRVRDEVIAADNIILAAGAWSGALKGIPAAQVPPVFPMKGQLLALQMEPRLPLLKHVVWTRHVYLVPRADGRLVVGATMEDKGFDEFLTGGGLLHLLRETWEVLPGIEELPLLECWAGFRPTSRDDAPILGPSGITGLTYATGQHRHGILFTPLLGDCIAHYIRQGSLPAVAAPFTQSRFVKF